MQYRAVLFICSEMLLPSANLTPRTVMSKYLLLKGLYIFHLFHLCFCHLEHYKIYGKKAVFLSLHTEIYAANVVSTFHYSIKELRFINQFGLKTVRTDISLPFYR